MIYPLFTRYHVCLVLYYLIDKESNRDQIEYFSQKNKEFFSQMKLEVNNLKNEKKELEKILNSKVRLKTFIKNELK